jgi:hypothetical protein
MTYDVYATYAVQRIYSVRRTCSRYLSRVAKASMSWPKIPPSCSVKGEGAQDRPPQELPSLRTPTISFHIWRPTNQISDHLPTDQSHIGSPVNRPITHQTTCQLTNHTSDHLPTDQSHIGSPANRPITHRIIYQPTNHISDHPPTNQSNIRSLANRPITHRITRQPTNHTSDHLSTDQSLIGSPANRNKKLKKWLTLPRIFCPGGGYGFSPNPLPLLRSRYQ